MNLEDILLSCKERFALERNEWLRECTNLLGFNKCPPVSAEVRFEFCLWVLEFASELPSNYQVISL